MMVFVLFHRSDTHHQINSIQRNTGQLITKLKSICQLLTLFKSMNSLTTQSSLKFWMEYITILTASGFRYTCTKPFHQINSVILTVGLSHGLMFLMKILNACCLLNHAGDYRRYAVTFMTDKKCFKRGNSFSLFFLPVWHSCLDVSR